MRAILLVACVLCLSACAQQQAARVAQQNRIAEQQRIAEGWRAAHRLASEKVAECRERRLRGELKSYVESVQCSTDFVRAAYRNANWPHMDLINLREAARMSGAEQVDQKVTTESGLVSQLAELDVRIRNELERRANVERQYALQRANALANQQAAAAAQSQANAANTAALIQGLSAFQATMAPPPSFAAPPRAVFTDCYRSGNVTNCVSQ